MCGIPITIYNSYANYLTRTFWPATMYRPAGSSTSAASVLSTTLTSLPSIVKIRAAPLI